jgi:hypothetical protein
MAKVAHMGSVEEKMRVAKRRQLILDGLGGLVHCTAKK